ncbi:alanine--glyoxylate aminotransferase family protein [Pseudanabaena sp. FACHB-2040]|uniref:pyridoxal-phosphate-dependent aminotransferase family protein n=1 Tax=Pseudanabaena sp. FACHB-2040 TaxID=2692859 RepID=UPI001683E8FD|nr:alanine--glyoxylate aminotransferase family protein [Pseudanabaena sp. FACHB-2040]MBD2259887.1 alanine--glyoxylate aminotransferase family protein [Pseudanabaena sp. FACHB-2040]
MTTAFSVSNRAVNEAHHLPLAPLTVPERLLLGPGPSNADPTVLAAMNRQPIGHLDPAYLKLMDEVQELLRYAWQTDNQMTYPVPGTGSAAMEATLANVVEPGDRVLVGVKGYFGHRLVDMAGRYGAAVSTITRPWGEAFTLVELRAAMEQHRPQVLALVHAETSTGVRQPLEGIGDLCREFDCLLIVDTVTSLGGVPIYLDDWKVDLAYSCSQKGLSCPPGMSPFTMNERAIAKLDRRQTPVANWYLDASLLKKYWGSDRVYHHTAPVNMTYAIREALRLVAEEGLAARWQRHQQTAEKLWDGLQDLGLNCHVDRDLRLPTLTTVRVPDGIDAKAVSRTLLNDYNIEVGGGLGDLAGKVWRVGLMGYNSNPENVDTLLETMGKVLAELR